MSNIGNKPSPAPPTWNVSRPEVDRMNASLRNMFGFDANDGNPIWRIVWSPDQYEKRMMDTTDEGLQLLSPEVRLVPRYSQWIGERWVLERYVIVPEFQRAELADAKLSYEPLWVFETQGGVYLPPNLEVAKIVIDSVYAAQGKSTMKKYTDPEAAEPLQARKERIDKISEELFGNETPVGDALAHKTGVTVPGNSNSPLITEK